MAVLGINQVLIRIKEELLVENLGPRELENPEGVGIDFRLGAIFQITKGGAFIEADGEAGLGKRKGVQTKEIAKHETAGKKQKTVTIKPGQYYLAQTLEVVNTPHDLMPVVYPRTSLFRAGILMLNSKTDPGYKGKLTFGMVNLSPFPVKLQMGARICNMVFFKIDGESVAYRGQHQGGRVTPQKVEQQV
ncbi:MAG TPA: hypothetical protein VJG66_02175 [Patescibacteria group bacterium]|nr:hypothetical protein [Patescibacteria group bacterium]